ncbi:hypothetical protein FC39_GL000576 [Lactobacillus hamsteri DSM 5661 = JCM 6256]|uniref:Metal-dependent hydrolase n=1 Tax=Lactobacillus hamsteri DSM 5661 = JCM 6256 TaxID=1423754 RepID=A0A0R1YD98_9LACO|nr:hypothetical protein FC39_GL000576 [Lactobacillus hamsteri DSM 5661 = JCM 6256]
MKEVLTRSHRLLSVAVVELGLIATDNFLINPASNIVLLLATAVGASLPDIDEYNSTVSRKSLINFSLFLRHRGITHSLLGWLIFAGGLYFLMNYFMPIKIPPHMVPNYWGSLWLGLVIGYFLHLVEDSFSNQGVNWLQPFFVRKKHGKFLHYKVNGPFEHIVTFIATSGIIFMTVYWIWILFKLPKI